jgi:hypothetical protein
VTTLVLSLEVGSAEEADEGIHRKYWNGLGIDVLTVGSWESVVLVVVPLYPVERSCPVQAGEAVYSLLTSMELPLEKMIVR